MYQCNAFSILNIFYVKIQAGNPLFLFLFVFVLHFGCILLQAQRLWRLAYISTVFTILVNRPWYVCFENCFRASINNYKLNISEII